MLLVILDFKILVFVSTLNCSPGSVNDCSESANEKRKALSVNEKTDQFAFLCHLMAMMTVVKIIMKTSVKDTYLIRSNSEIAILTF